MKYTVIRVGSGDTAGSLARKYNTTERSIFLLNNPSFFEGERLIIRENSGGIYTVGPFDTADSIADKCGISKEKLIKLNGTDKFFLGQSVLISDDGE